jgi:hypothetical protein
MIHRVQITPGFWHDRLEINATSAIFHQWEQLEASGCIENFRIAAGEKDGFREGWFFADSDAYKWLDAAARIFASHPDPRLAALMDDFIALLGRAQQPDGYLFTYNQIHFPGTRWINLQIEHELYCHGHLIEAGVSHFETTGRTNMLDIARQAADRVVEDFIHKGPAYTPGHEEIEIALLRLHQVTDHEPYLEMARRFIERRGRNPLFGLSILSQNGSVAKRGVAVRQEKDAYVAAHPAYSPNKVPPGNFAKKPRNSALRWYASALTGKYFQQHIPVRRQRVPVGHSVRFGYLETAVAMLLRQSGDASLLPALEQAWERMVTRRMYITGGIGSLPGLEGFGNDYELDPEYAYAETCAALASIFWSWEMAGITGEAKYSDLLEWQLYNASGVGMGLDGTTYLYNNPLTCRGGVTRKPWYAVPCCPSNLSRTWADLGKYVFSSGGDEIRIHQYISSEANSECAKVKIQSGLPWDGKVEITVNPPETSEFTLSLRIPSWSQASSIKVNEKLHPSSFTLPTLSSTACGYDPRRSTWLSIRREWLAGDVVALEFDMSVRLWRTHPKVRGQRGKAALSRGPLVYCLESLDNPDVDLFTASLDASSLQAAFDENLFGGVVKIEGKTKDGQPLTFVPYMLWGNRGESQMNVFVNM